MSFITNSLLFIWMAGYLHRAKILPLNLQSFCGLSSVIFYVSLEMLPSIYFVEVGIKKVLRIFFGPNHLFI